jgi:putative DNA primase/helicase
MGHDGRSRIRSPDTRAPMPPPGGKRGRPRGAQVARPRLLLADNNDRATIDEAVALLAKHPNARIYRQDATDKLVECRADTDGRVRLAPLGEERLAVLIGDVADTCAERERRSGPTVVAVRPPLWLLKAILTGAAEVPWPTLEGLALTPTMRPDGTILSAPGYDPSTRLFYAPDASYPPLIEHPTQADATAAIERLLDLFREFPFGAEHHRAAAVAAVMTLVLRAGIEGATPMFAIDATTPGSGKGLIASIAAMIATGRPADLERMPNEDELEKRLVSDLIAGRTMKILDNVTAALESNTLCAFITAYRYRSRILGASETVEFPQRMVLFATGNNLAIRGDMPRRVVRCYLAPNTERPEARRFKRADLIGFVRTCRTGFVRDILTVARAYITAGRPLAGTLTPTGSFEEWSSVVREPLVWLGLRDPWDGTQAELAGDPLLEDARELLAALATEFGATEFAPAELTDLEAQTCASETIRRIVAAFTDGRSCTPARALSDTFRGLEGRILGGRRLSKGGRGRKGQRWRIEAAAPTDDVTPPHTGVTAANPCATGVPARP